MSKFLKRISWLFAALIAAGALGYLWVSGSAVVVDYTGGVTSAFAVDGHGNRQRLHRIWSGYFRGVPRIEGTIEIRCINGMRKQWGYVTPGINTKIRVVGSSPCERVEHAIY